MELGFDAKRLFCNFTGLGNYSRTLLKNLANYYPEHNLHLYTPCIRHNSDTKPFLEEQTYNVHLPDGKYKKLWRSWSVVQDMQKDGVELFHGLSHEIPLRIRKSGIRSVVSIHDLIFKVYPETYSAIDRKIYDLKFGYACRNADRIIAISESTKRDIIRFYDISPDKIQVVYQPCGNVYYSLQSENQCKKILQQYGIPQEFILSVGSIEKRKNLKTILKAYSLLPSEYRIPLVIVGHGKKYKKESQDLAADLGISQYLHWLNFVESTEHLQAFYQCAMMMVYPSIYEGFGLPVAEALLSKTPVITSNVSSMPEAAGPASICVNPHNADEIAIAIEKVLTSGTLRDKMIKEGYDYAKNKFSAKNTTRQIVELYESII